MAKELAILGRKMGMVRLFNSDGSAIPCTVIEAGPCPITQIKEASTDGYDALQIAFEEIPERKVNKPSKGHQAKAGRGFYRHLEEVRLDSVEGYELGGDITVSSFALGDRVKITGTSKGKGYQGVMKRWNFRGSCDSHGAEKVHRSGGTIGHNTFPGKVFKNKKMAGQMGNKKVTVLNLEVVDVRPDDNLILVRGAVPGPKNAVVMVRKQTKG